MSRTENRTSSFRSQLHKGFVSRSLSRENIRRHRKKLTHERQTIMEMWENYLNFTRLEL